MEKSSLQNTCLKVQAIIWQFSLIYTKHIYGKIITKNYDERNICLDENLDFMNIPLYINWSHSKCKKHFFKGDGVFDRDMFGATFWRQVCSALVVMVDILAHEPSCCCLNFTNHEKENIRPRISIGGIE